MKKIALLIIVISYSLFVVSYLFSQSPNQFKYQVVVRDLQGNLTANQTVYFKISILKGSSLDTVSYSELQQTVTNQFGLASLNIGTGTSQQGSISNINWGAGTYFIQVEYSQTSGGTYQIMGTSQLLSVPYSLYSAKAGTLGITGTTGQTLLSNGTSWQATSNLTNNGTNVGVGTSNPQELVDMSSKSMGVLIPRMTTSQRNSMATPIPESTMIYNTDTHCFEAYYELSWTDFGCLQCKVPDTAGSISGNDNPCQGQAYVTYSIESIPNATGYKWTVFEGAVITSGANTNSITVSYSVLADAGTITVYGTNVCGSGSSSSIFIDLNLAPGAYNNVSGGGSYCSGGTGVPVGLSITNAGAVYQLQVNGNNIGSTIKGTGNAMSFGNQTAAGTYSVVATSSQFGCTTKMLDSVIVTLIPIPVINQVTESICSKTSTDINSPNNQISLGWTIGTITGGIKGPVSGLGSSINQTLSNPSNTTTGSVQYLVTPISSGCSGQTVSDTVIVYPLPVVTNTSTYTICSGESTDIALTSSVPSSFAWTIGTITGSIIGASAGSGSSINQILTNPGNVAGTVQYFVTPTSIIGECLGLRFTITITVNPLPDITFITPPKIKCSRDSALFKVIATGTGNSYQWEYDGISLPGANQSTYTVSNVSLNNAGTYTCAVSNTCGTVYAYTSLTLNSSPTITSTIGNQTACTGSTVTFTVNATGGNLSYQWIENTVNIPGATNSSYTINNIVPSDAGIYTCKVSNNCGTESLKTFILTINQPPALNLTPVVINKNPGDSVVSCLSPSGTPPFSYQWLFDNNIIPGATTSCFKLKPIVCGDGGLYSAIVSNICGNTTAIILTLNTCNDSITGKVLYDNTPQTPLPNTVVYLLNSQSQKLDSTTTNSTGAYKFSNLVNGTYTLECGKTTMQAGGWSPMDAFIIDQYYVGLLKITDALKKEAGDVNNSGGINPIDGLLINQRYIGSIGNFSKADWLFQSPTVVCSTASTIQNILGICAGDVNGTYLSTINLTSSTATLTIGSASVAVGDSVTIPVTVTNFNSIGCFGLQIHYDSSVLSYGGTTNINSSISSSLLSEQTGNQLNYALSSGTGKGLNIGNVTLFNMRFKYNGGTTILTILPQSIVGNASDAYLNVTYTNGAVVVN